ncbi:MAG: universal stress protein [Desulfobacteraceae bacterium]
MEKHLLVTVSEQQSALYGIRFVGQFFSNKDHLKLTLFYTAPKPAAVWHEEHTRDALAQSEQQARQYETKGRKALQEAKKELVKYGFAEKQISPKFQVRQLSKVMDIIQEAEKGLYDAVVLGRRGLSWLAEAFDESVSKGVLGKKITFPLWLCRRPDLERKNVLLCLDGSDAAYRMADHLGFVLSNEKKHEATLLLIKKPGAASKESPESILSKGKEHLARGGYPVESTKTKIIESGNVAKTILKEAEKNRFAAVAVGRTGANKAFLRRVFMGSVSKTLFDDLERAALWVSP